MLCAYDTPMRFALSSKYLPTMNNGCRTLSYGCITISRSVHMLANRVCTISGFVCNVQWFPCVFPLLLYVAHRLPTVYNDSPTVSYSVHKMPNNCPCSYGVLLRGYDLPLLSYGSLLLPYSVLQFAYDVLWSSLAFP